MVRKGFFIYLETSAKSETLLHSLLFRLIFIFTSYLIFTSLILFRSSIYVNKSYLVYFSRLISGFLAQRCKESLNMIFFM